MMFLVSRWKDLSVSKKLYMVVGLMAVLIAMELFTLLFAIQTLSSVRAFVMGEGLWTKAQKDAIQSLYQYARNGDEKFYQDFKNFLKIPEGDHKARIEMSKPDANYDLIVQGFLEGGNDPNDIPGMIQLLKRFHFIAYIREAIQAWTRADLLIEKLVLEADGLHLVLQKEGPASAHVEAMLERISNLNAQLTREEIYFSSQLGEGSRWLEGLLTFLLALIVFTVESTGLFLTFLFSRNLNRSLHELKEAAAAVGQGTFSKMAPVHSRDELGQLAESLNTMIHDLKANIDQRIKVENQLKFLNEDLEKRVQIRTREIERTERQLRYIANALPEMVGEIDRDLNILFANEAFSKWFGHSIPDLLGQNLRKILGTERFPLHEPHLMQALQGKQVTYEQTSANESAPTSYSITLVPEFDLSANVTGCVMVAVNITHYKRIQNDLRSAKLEADRANAIKSTFLANMSHEIRTPLGAILGFSELMATENDKMTDDEREKNNEIIKRNGRLLSNLINDILDLSKVEAGKLSVHRTLISLEEILSEIQDLWEREARAKSVEFVITLVPPLPKTISSDALRLRQILLNIIGNAVKFTNQGMVEVIVQLVPDSHSKQKISFTVRDSGKGIEKDQIPKLFSPFSQADPSTTREFGGTGLGLVLSRRLANALGGDVTLLESVAGQGSTFVVTVETGLENPDKSTKREASIYTPTESLPPREVLNSSAKILIVDDSPDNLLLVTKMLAPLNLAIETASNGEEAVQKAFAQSFDLILMDLQMPIMDGYLATKTLRSKGFRNPIVALTAHAMKSERDRCLQEGFDEQITKPIDRKLLIKLVHDYLDSSQRQKEPGTFC